MRFTRSECPDCTKEVLMTLMYAKKRDASQIARASRASLYGYFVWRPPLRLLGAAGEAEARELWQSACGSASRTVASQ